MPPSSGDRADHLERFEAMADEYELHPPVARWTHIAVPCGGIDLIGGLASAPRSSSSTS